MGATETNSFALRLIQNLKDEVKRDKKDCQSEAIDLFKKIFNAIDTHTDTPSVNIGLDGLASEVSDLEAKLSNITNERDSLLSTVHSLRAENRQLSKLFLPTIPLPPMPDQKAQKSPLIKDVKSLYNGSSSAIEIDTNRSRTHARGGKQKKQKHKIQRPLNDANNLDDYDFNEVEDADVKEIEYVVSGREEVSETKDLIQKLIREGQDDVKKIDTQDYYDQDPDYDPEFQDTPNKRFKCDQCSWSTPQRHRMKAHVEEVHEKIKSHNCEECGYATSRRDRLERHWDARHNQGEKKFKCGRCPYSSPENAKLQKHIERIHG